MQFTLLSLLTYGEFRWYFSYKLIEHACCNKELEVRPPFERGHRYNYRSGDNSAH
jgi:hypothetical protein